jgi:hypothetical protein
LFQNLSNRRPRLQNHFRNFRVHILNKAPSKKFLKYAATEPFNLFFFEVIFLVSAIDPPGSITYTNKAENFIDSIGGEGFVDGHIEPTPGEKENSSDKDHQAYSVVEQRSHPGNLLPLFLFVFVKHNLNPLRGQQYRKFYCSTP